MCRSASQRLTSVVAAFAFGVVGNAAHAAPTRFVGPHPIAVRAGGGYCTIESPHLHSYAPEHAVFYHPTARGLVFIGDPTPFGYDGERHVFYGHHPVPVDGEAAPQYCLIDGPHQHAFAPGRFDDYDIVDGIAFWVGPLPPAYIDERAKHWKAVNDDFAPFARFRPTVNVLVPPADWKGRIYIPPDVKIQYPLVHKQHVRRTHVHVDVQQ